jgi:hypothetical protein
MDLLRVIILAAKIYLKIENSIFICRYQIINYHAAHFLFDYGGIDISCCITQSPSKQVLNQEHHNWRGELLLVSSKLVGRTG